MALRKLYTLSELTNKAIVYIGANSTITDFTPGGVVRAIIDSTASFIEYLQLQINLAFQSFYITTAKGADLKNRANDVGVNFKYATPAKGIIKFVRNSVATSTFVIGAGTTVSTQPDVFGTTINYTLDSDVTFVTGSTSATGNITCAITGTQGNVASGTITNMTSNIAGIDSIYNIADLTSGSSDETDDALRARIPITISGYKKGNEDSIKSSVLAVNGITLVKTASNSPSPGYVTVYVSNESGVLSSDQKTAALTAAQTAAAFGINVSLVTPTVVYVTITLDAEIDVNNFDETSVKNTMKQQIYDFVTANSSTDLQSWDIALAARTGGVHNIKNVLINGQVDYMVNGFSVIRIADKDTSTTINTLPLTV